MTGAIFSHQDRLNHSKSDHLLREKLSRVGLLSIHFVFLLACQRLN
uniref:Uncharacterized protein n=1 Tax=Anguilla anguilla TaxID=7936 RepID=A0A0E9V2J6_ANGAN